jgi:CheY-like chemotaxis protein
VKDLTMTALPMMDRPANGVGSSNAYTRFETSLEAAVRADSIEWLPVDEENEPLLRVLIVDDHQASADMLFELVGIWGHDVRRAYDGVRGLAQAAAFWPDVLLLDISMTSVGGTRLANDIRRQPRLKDCFIIAVTDSIDKINRRQREEEGIDLFLTKPIDLSNLQTLLTRISEYRFGVRAHTATQHAISTPYITTEEWQPCE